jgi:hypothetical protein
MKIVLYCIVLIRLWLIVGAGVVVRRYILNRAHLNTVLTDDDSCLHSCIGTEDSQRRTSDDADTMQRVL